MRFEFYKILDRKYAEDFQRGYLYMNTLNYFREIEKNNAQGDCLEGIYGTIRKEQLKQFGFQFDPNLIKAIKGNITLISDYYGLNNLFCLYRLFIDDTKKIVWAPNEELRKFNDLDIENKVIVHIKDTEKFLVLVNHAIQNELKKRTIEYGIYGNVVYCNAWIHADGPGTRSAFHKGSDYAYQNEWRLCLLRYALDNSPYQLAIGDLSDITEIISLEQFLVHPEKIYPGYGVANEDVSDPAGEFQILGAINAVNHLMFSYTQPPKDRPIRSDQAQADWHYARYLDLSGETKKIDAYFEARMKESRNLDHLELLVQHRLAEGEWVKATDAFMFFINEASDVISTNPSRFFFAFHSILMQYQDPAGAAKLYKIAINHYQLPEELKQIMHSDFLFALGFYDKVIPIYNKMKETNADPILDFNLAVSYLHILDIEKAYRHLVAYEHYFSHSQHVAQKTSQIHEVIHCFYYKTQLKVRSQKHIFQVLDWNHDLERLLEDPQKKSIYLGIDSLYQFEKAQKWRLIDKFEEITVCPLTIARVMELYQQSGDPIFFHIVDRLINLPIVEICSPELDYYLALDISKRELLPHLKMEQALYWQEFQIENCWN